MLTKLPVLLALFGYSNVEAVKVRHTLSAKTPMKSFVEEETRHPGEYSQIQTQSEVEFSPSSCKAGIDRFSDTAKGSVDAYLATQSGGLWEDPDFPVDQGSTECQKDIGPSAVTWSPVSDPKKLE